MTETTPNNPCSRKGEIRARIAMNLEDEINKKNLNAIIARSADLYGPWSTKTSVPYILAIDKLLFGKNAQWMIDVNKLHSFTYTLDAAKGMFLLSTGLGCFNQTWHLPTFNPAIDGETFIELVANEVGVEPDYTILKKWMLRMISPFNKTVAESYEMLYQSEFDYCFDSTKFNNFFNFKPKSYHDGIHVTIEFFKKNRNWPSAAVIQSDNLYL